MILHPEAVTRVPGITRAVKEADFVRNVVEDLEGSPSGMISWWTVFRPGSLVQAHLIGVILCFCLF